ncbi:MAG: hypothetical protein AB8B51_11235, partial [Sedimentitalea sp.]
MWLISTAMILFTNTALADAIPSTGPLPDDAFYSLVSCGAKPGPACAKPHRAWPQSQVRDLTVSIAMVQNGYPTKKAALLRRSNDRAIQDINGQRSKARLRWRKPGEAANIAIYMVNSAQGHRMRATQESGLDGRRVGNATVISVRKGAVINRGIIAFSRSMRNSEADSIALEEIYQALGFMHDIKIPAYRNRSIF